MKVDDTPKDNDHCEFEICKTLMNADEDSDEGSTPKDFK